MAHLVRTLEVHQLRVSPSCRSQRNIDQVTGLLCTLELPVSGSLRSPLNCLTIIVIHHFFGGGKWLSYFSLKLRLECKYSLHFWKKSEVILGIYLSLYLFPLLSQFFLQLFFLSVYVVFMCMLCKMKYNY